MTQEIWFKNDIRHVLMGVDLANSHLARRLNDHESQVFREGFQAALAAAAVSFGLQPSDAHSARLLDMSLTSECGRSQKEPSALIALGVTR